MRLNHMEVVRAFEAERARLRTAIEQRLQQQMEDTECLLEHTCAICYERIGESEAVYGACVELPCGLTGAGL